MVAASAVMSKWRTMPPGAGSAAASVGPTGEATAVGEHAGESTSRRNRQQADPDPGHRGPILRRSDERHPNSSCDRGGPHAVAEGTRHILEQSQDIEVVGEAGRGDEAVELIKRLAPDVVLLDMRLPGMNGIEVARAVTGSTKRFECSC